MTVADFMTEALLHPTHGYYTTRDPLGAAGDFTTAPEISQMFGELIGLALAQ
ncbi:MAG: class I SAM-dependent methyltransferase, partial [Shimia sp.]|nr:class I SAM-dependent methyltransferase [Shimia sp.]